MKFMSGAAGMKPRRTDLRGTPGGRHKLGSVAGNQSGLRSPNIARAYNIVAFLLALCMAEAGWVAFLTWGSVFP